MAQDLSYENSEYCFFATIRTINSRLWFVNNKLLEHKILAFLAKYQEKYQITIYGFILMGNHYHLIAKFPNENKASFFRSFNAIVAKLTNSLVGEYEGGKLWARRVRVQVLPNDDDILHWFYYLVLNPVSSGLVSKISDYESYNSFSDCTKGRVRKFKLVDWSDYRNRVRYNSVLKPNDCLREYKLTYSRLPGFEKLSQKEYAVILHKQMEERRAKLLLERQSQGKSLPSKKYLTQQVPGQRPKNTKTSKRDSYRPLVLTLCKETKQTFLSWYFSLLSKYKNISEQYRRGIRNVIFPNGTYRPFSYSSV
ncbi:MAG: transposase [Proteobacteria bacterium]|nr:transposase [Pseudomonadota bacterium]